MGLWKHLLLLSFILLLISKCETQQQDDTTSSSSSSDDNNNDNNDVNNNTSSSTQDQNDDDGDGDYDSDSEDDGDDDDDDGDDDDSQDRCSFISGQGCLNGICKYCAMCIPSNCILGTPYSTGNNDGSTCDAIGEESGYDFYNYCLSPGDQYLDDDTSNGCPTSTVCYQYRHSSHTHAWDNLTCAQDSCLLLNRDGTPPPVPSSDNINITVSGPNNSHPTRQHYSQLDIKSGSAASIALLTSCIVLGLCLVALLTRWFCRTRLKRKIALFLNNDVSPPPSFHSTTPSSNMMMMMMVRTPSHETLPDYDENLPPKYEHAIVTQIRGFASSSSTSEWIPVYVSPLPAPPNDSIQRNRTQHGFHWVPSHQDWATIQHDQ